MRYAATAWYKTKTTTTLARDICAELMESGQRTIRPVLCRRTGHLFFPDLNWKKVERLSPNVEGAHFKAYGYYYLLCLDPVTKYEYVEVLRIADGKLIGRVYKPEEIQVSTI